MKPVSRCIAAIFLVIMVLASSLVWATDRHVGSGQTYSTIASAIAASSSGDNIVIHEGTYNETFLQPKSGTTFISAKRFDSETYGSESMPILDAGYTAWDNNHDHSVFHMWTGQSNVTFDGLDMRNGARATLVTSNSSNDGITIQNCHFQVDYRNDNPADNAALIWFDVTSYNVLIKNNTFTQNTIEYHGILLNTPNTTSYSIENNSFDINTTGNHGIFVKWGGTATGGRMQIKNNFIDMTGDGGDGKGIYLSQDNVDVTNNLIVGSNGRSGIEVGLDSGGCGGDGVVIDHNTIYFTSLERGAITIENDCNPDHITITNNVIYKGNNTTEYSLVSLWIYGSAQTIDASDYNLFRQSSSGRDIIKRVGTGYTLAEWQAATTFDDHSLDAAPVFVGGASPISIADYALNTGSPGKSACADSSDMGADVSLVGVDAGEEDPPSTPSFTGVMTGSIR